MKTGKKILLVFDVKRKDLYSYLSADATNEYYILFNNEPTKGHNNLPKFIRGEFYWSDYKTPFKLLQSINPDKIVFQEIFDLKQIALNIAARKLKIETIFLDHGIWSDFISIKRNDLQRQQTGRKKKLQKLKKPHSIPSGYFFYFSAFPGVGWRDLAKFFFFPFLAFSKSLLTAMHKIRFNERKPERFILFTKHNFNTISDYYGCSENEVTYTGFPFFDGFAKKRNESTNKGYIVFIDHPYLELSMLGWDENFHEKVARTIKQISSLSKKKVFIKLHPKSDINKWKTYTFLDQEVEIIQHQIDESFYLDADLIFGYASTLLVGFICSRRNVVLLGWHPCPLIFGIDFSKYNICHKSLELGDVNSKLPYWLNSNLALQNKQHFIEFCKIFNNPFDGKATERVIGLIS